MIDYTSQINKFEDIEEIIRKYKNVYIFGGGKIGFFTFRSLYQRYKNKIKAFVVSCKKNDRYSNTDIFCDKSLIEVSDNLEKDALFIISAEEKHHESIIGVLKKYNYNNVLRVTYTIFDMIAKHIIECDSIYNGILDNADYEFDGIKISQPNKLKTPLYELLAEIDDLMFGNRSFLESFNLITEGPYELENFKIESEDEVFDIGAHVGIFSCIAATKGKLVYAFEPSNAHILDINKQSELYDNRIIAVNCALSDYVGTASFCEAGSQGKLINKDNNNENDSIETVKVTTIDEFVKENNIPKVDFIKADIEGAERDMLKGAVNVLKIFAPKLSICTYHLPDDKEVLEKIVKDANPKYNVIHKYKKMYCWVDKE